MSLSNPLRSEFSLKKTVMIIFIAIILICLITITGYYYQKTSQEIDERFIQELNQTELHLKSASEQITKGQMLWEATYRQPLLDVASRVLEEYERSSHIPSKMNLKEVLNQTDPSYRSRIDIMLINASGVAEYSTSSKELYLDFSQWQPFFQTLTDMRMNNSFRLDRAVRGFDTTNPWRIFGYQPTPDHQYLIQITYRIYDDFNTERSKLSLHDLVTRLINQHPNVLALDLIGSTGMIISEVDEIPVLADPIDKEIAQDVYRTHESRDYIDENSY